MLYPAERMIFIPRNTPLVGTEVLYLPPVNIQPYASANLVAWQGTGIGSSPATVQFTIQQSPDLENWLEDTVLAPLTADSEATAGIFIVFPWLRVQAAVTGADPAVTCSLLGEFYRREDIL